MTLMLFLLMLRQIINLNHKFQMEKYVTPIKENYYYPWKTTSQKQGDWVCLNCNNLNFSFRKKCNRCKVQSKYQNKFVNYSPHYYYIQPNNMQSASNTRQPLASYHYQFQCNISTPSQQKQQKPIIKPELPSVSPLIKKYKQSKFQSAKTNNTACVLDFSDKCDNWQNFEYMQNQQLMDEQIGQDEELQKIISKIIL